MTSYMTSPTHTRPSIRIIFEPSLYVGSNYVTGLLATSSTLLWQMKEIKVMRKEERWQVTLCGTGLGRARRRWGGIKGAYNPVRDACLQEHLIWRDHIRGCQLTIALDIEHTLLSLQDAYLAYAELDKSSSPTNLAKWLAISQDEFASIPDMWKLRNLCVSPDFQRRGIGALLMAWGKEQAEREGCPIGLSSSTKGKGLYEKQGFRRYSTIKVDGFPVDDVPVLLWEPKGMEGRWGSGTDTKIQI